MASENLRSDVIEWAFLRKFMGRAPSPAPVFGNVTSSDCLAGGSEGAHGVNYCCSRPWPRNGDSVGFSPLSRRRTRL